MYQLDRLKHTGAIIAVAGVIACATKYQPPGGNTAYGPYQFKQLLPNANPPLTLEGTVVVLPGDLKLSVNGKPCSPEPFNNSPEGTFFGFDCGDYTFRFSRDNPLRSNSYRVPTMRWEMRRVCKEYRTNPQTQAEYCYRYTQERVESRTVLSGSLTFLQR
jgi:hypothetical protein